LGSGKYDLAEIFQGETKEIEIPLQRVPTGSVFLSIESINYGKVK
jgi:hypothetical protein